MTGQRERGETPPDEDVGEARAEALQLAASWTRYSMLGVQFALTPVAFGWGGYWLDGKYGSSPWGTIAGVVVGFFGASIWLYFKIYPYKGGDS
ncbi:MAG: AtpZ/AtpI family protein [Planctomycetota bacterium]